VLSTGEVYAVFLSQEVSDPRQYGVAVVERLQGVCLGW